MKVRMKKGIAVFLTAMMVLAMAFQSIAAPLSSMNPAAASEPAKITGTWSTDASGSWRFNAPDGAAKDGWYYLNTTNNATDYNWFCFDANGVMRTGWVQDKNDPSVWYYTGESKDSSEGGLVKGWITDPQDGKKYYLDPSTGVMCHGWKQISGVWYYFGESRYADRKWAPDTTGYWKAGASGKHSYGSLYMNEYTPDGYYVGANGAWVQDHSEDDNSDKPDPAPETKKLSEILPSGFPTSADFAWVNADSKKAYRDGDNIKVGSLTLGKDTTATKSGDNYVCKSGDATVTFNVKDGVAENITVTGSSDSNGTYTAPETKALSEILPTDFPSSADSAWVNADGLKAYRDDDTIKVGNLTLGKDTTVTKSGDNYVCKSGDATVTFNVKDGAAESITVTGSSDSNGTYAPAAPLVSVTSVFLDKAELSITVGDPDVELTATVLPDNATNKAVTWTSNNTNVATVDDEGNVHAVAAGNATITVTTVDGGKTATCDVTVTAPTYNVTFNLNGITGTAPTSQKIKDGEKVTKPADPTDTIHTFAGWYKTKDATTGALSDPWDFDNDTVTADMTLYAQWTTIISKIVGTNTGIPTVANFDWSNPKTASIPENAWVTDDGKKAFWVPGDNGGFAILHTTVTEDQTIIQVFGLDDTDTFTKVGDTYVLSTAQFTATCTMADGKFTSLTFAGIDLSALGVKDSSIFDGTYTAPAAPTFKAVYNTTEGANTLTFYYDAVDHRGEGITVYENGTANFLFDDTNKNGAKWGYNGKRGSIKSVVIDVSVAAYKGLTSTAFMFQGMTIATNISGAEYLDVSKVTDMSLMFMNFGGGSTNSHTTLNSVPDVSKWNTANVKNMTGMFWDYGNFSDNLTKVPDVSKWNTANVTNMAGMFQQYGYSSINFNDVPKVSGWSTISVEDMSTMFRDYGKNSTALTAVPEVCNWNTAEVKTMAEMFREYGASSTVLKAVPDVRGWNTSNVTTMVNLFQNYGNGSVDFQLDLSGWDLSKIASDKGDNVFSFTPKTFKVTIPAKTGDKDNDSNNWYYGDGTNTIAPPKDKTFTLAAPTISTIADVLATAGDNAPSATSHWYDTKGNYIYTNGGQLLVYVNLIGEAGVALDNTVTPNGDNYLYSKGVLSFTFNMTEGVLTSIHVNMSVYGVNDTFSPAPAVSTKLTLGVSGGQTHDASMAETEVSEPTAEVFEPEFEPEKFEEAKPEELIEPAEAVAEEAAP